MEKIPIFNPPYNKCLWCDHEMELFNDSSIEKHLWCSGCPRTHAGHPEPTLSRTHVYGSFSDTEPTDVVIQLDEHLMLSMGWKRNVFLNVWNTSDMKNLIVLNETFPYQHDLEYLRRKVYLYLKLS